MITAAISILAALGSLCVWLFRAKNRPDMVANKIATEDAKREESNATVESAAAAGNELALEQMRRAAAED